MSLHASLERLVSHVLKAICRHTRIRWNTRLQTNWRKTVRAIEQKVIESSTLQDQKRKWDAMTDEVRTRVHPLSHGQCDMSAPVRVPEPDEAALENIPQSFAENDLGLPWPHKLLTLAHTAIAKQPPQIPLCSRHERGTRRGPQNLLAPLRLTDSFVSSTESQRCADKLWRMGSSILGSSHLRLPQLQHLGLGKDVC